MEIDFFQQQSNPEKISRFSFSIRPCSHRTFCPPAPAPSPSGTGETAPIGRSSQPRSPPALRLDTQLVGLLSEADAAVGELAGVGRQLPNPNVLIVPYTRREAVLSSRIEGTRASVGDVFADEILHATPSATSPDVQEVRNYIAALDAGWALVRAGRTLDRDLVLGLHHRLMTSVRGQDKHPGEFRETQNWIGVARSTPSTAIFVPPHPDDLAAALGDWERFVQRDGATLPPLLACGLLHSQFETIHPFMDGNGRVGRLLIPLYLLARGRLAQPLLYLSAYIEPRKAEYARCLQRVRTDGEWEGWLEFFLRGVAETAADSGERAKRIVAFYEEARDLVEEDASAMRLLRQLLVNPFIATSTAMKALDVTAPTARKALDLLVAKGILQESDRRGRTPLFVAESLLAIFSETSL